MLEDIVMIPETLGGNRLRTDETRVDLFSKDACPIVMLQALGRLAVINTTTNSCRLPNSPEGEEPLQQGNDAKKTPAAPPLDGWRTTKWRRLEWSLQSADLNPHRDAVASPEKGESLLIYNKTTEPTICWTVEEGWTCGLLLKISKLLHPISKHSLEIGWRSSE